MHWNEENTSLLRQWWEIDKLSSPEIVGKFSVMGIQITRNSVMGKINRLKLVSPKAKEIQQRQELVRRTIFRNMIARVKEKATHGKRYRKRNHLMAIVKPTGDNAILLKHSHEGQCKAIIGYTDGKLENAVYCGEKATPYERKGRMVQTSWCPYHRTVYFTEDKK